MMAHLLHSLDGKKDIGHYGRLVFAMIARHFLDDNPPRPERIREWQNQQEFPICPNNDDPTPAISIAI